MPDNANQEFLKKLQNQKEFENRMNELRRQDDSRLRASISDQQAVIEEGEKKLFGLEAKFKETTDENHRTLGTESFAAIIRAMGKSLQAYMNMRVQAKHLFLRQLVLKISENINSSDLTILALIVDKARELRVALDRDYGTEGHFSDLPPVFVPYMAEVDEHNVLKLDLNVPNHQISDNDKNLFLETFGPDFQAVSKEWINTTRDDTGALLYELDESNPDAPKIRILASGEYMNSAQFRAFRDEVMSPHLKNYFDNIDFRPEPSPGCNPAF